MSIGVGPRTQLAYIAEVTHGTTPASPTTKILRSIGRKINLTKQTVASKETWVDRNVHDLRHGFNQVAASIPFELACLTWDDMLASLLGGAWASNVLKVGTTLTTFTFERRFLDLAGTTYEVSKGMAPADLQMSVKPEAIVNASMTFIGMSASAPAATICASPTAAPTNAPFDSFIGTISEGGSPIAVVTDLTLNIKTGRTLAGVIGSKFSPDVFEGVCMVTGSVSAFFQDDTLLTKFLAETPSSLSITFNDLNGTNSQTWLLPNIKYTGNEKDPPSEGGIVQVMPFQALYDVSTGTSIQITRV